MGSINKEDEKGIAKAVEYAEEYNGPIVEIGALFGHTTQLIATLKDIERELIAVISPGILLDYQKKHIGFLHIERCGIVLKNAIQGFLRALTVIFIICTRIPP